MKNWKTTLSGLVAAIGAYLAQSDNPLTLLVGQILSTIGLILLGNHAADKK